MMTAQAPTQGTLTTAQAGNGKQHYPRAYERPCAIALLTQINSHYGNKPLDDAQVDNFVNEIDHTIKADEARQAIIEFFQTHSSREAWIAPYDINQMVRRKRLSRVPSNAEISRMLDGYGITDANTAWGFRRGLTYAISKGASPERAIEYAKRHCDDVKTISNTPDQYPQLTAGDNVGKEDGVTSFSALLKDFRSGLERTSTQANPVPTENKPTIQKTDKKEETKQ